MLVCFDDTACQIRTAGNADPRDRTAHPKLAVPIALTQLGQIAMMTTDLALIGLIGTTALAAHQIALQIAAILFMVPFGIGMAATVRVGHAVGRGDTPAVRRAGFVATLLGIVFMSTMTLAVIVGRFAIARFFFGEAVQTGLGAIGVWIGLSCGTAVHATPSDLALPAARSPLAPRYKGKFARNQCGRMKRDVGVVAIGGADL
jgi:Na+-driven multidrug efflux pump